MRRGAAAWEALGLGPSGEALKSDGADVLFGTVGGLARRQRIGLSLSPHATTPDSKISVAAGRVRSDDDTFDLVLASATGLDLGLAGPAANGRDQAGAFGASSWVYGHVIGGGANPIALLASASATAPTLPGTYTKSALLCPIRLDGSANVLPFYGYADDRVSYKRRQSIGASNSTTKIVFDVSSLIPPQSDRFDLEAEAREGAANSGSQYDIFVKGDATARVSVKQAYATGCCGQFNMTFSRDFPAPTRDFEFQRVVGTDVGDACDLWCQGYAYSRGV